MTKRTRYKIFRVPDKLHRWKYMLWDSRPKAEVRAYYSRAPVAPKAIRALCARLNQEDLR